MGDTVTSQTLVDTPSHCVIVFTSESDGTGETNVAKFDVSTLAIGDGKCKILRIWWTTIGIGVKILWNASTNVLAFLVPSDSHDHHDFRPFGGLKNNAGAGLNGDILFTTVGHSTDNPAYWIMIEVEADH